MLAASAKTRFPDADMRQMEGAEFQRFLYIPEKPEKPKESDPLEIFNEIEIRGDGTIGCRLITRTRSPAGITRAKSHVLLSFRDSTRNSTRNSVRNSIRDSARDSIEEISFSETVDGDGEDPFEIPANRLYGEMVPLGPAYRNLIQKALLWEHRAEALVRAPDLKTAAIHCPGSSAGEGPLPDQLGSPFPLDAAFHLACAWGGRYADVVAFPVGMADRQILRPTRPGKIYLARVKPHGNRKNPASSPSDLLVFDIELHDALGICERAHGVQMRDVSRGRMRPPDWVNRKRV